MLEKGSVTIGRGCRGTALINPASGRLKLPYVARKTVVMNICNHARPEEMFIHLPFGLQMRQVACDRTSMGLLQHDLAAVGWEH